MLANQKPATMVHWDNTCACLCNVKRVSNVRKTKVPNAGAVFRRGMKTFSEQLFIEDVKHLSREHELQNNNPDEALDIFLFYFCKRFRNMHQLENIQLETCMMKF